MVKMRRRRKKWTLDEEWESYCTAVLANLLSYLSSTKSLKVEVEVESMSQDSCMGERTKIWV
jgi:hypothetical protein